jgi:predicted lipoprotein with Yx(FWY)xxD motif
MLSRSRALISLVVLVAVAAMAATGGAATRKGALVKVSKTTLGRILVDSRGRTLYLFEKDKSRGSMCSGSCATFWPPLLTSGKPRAGAGVKAALLGTIKRAGGARQVTYRGHPLYTFKLERAGQTRGEGLTDFGRRSTPSRRRAPRS